MRYFFIILLGSLLSCGPATKQKRIQRTFELANTKLEQGYYNEAVMLYSQVISKDPEIIDAFMNRGVAYFESGHFALSLADYNHVYFNYPEYPEVIFNRVYCHLELSRFDQAKNDLQQLKSIYPDSALVDVIEGLFWVKQNHLTNAIQSFSNSIKKDSLNFDAWTNRGILNYRVKNFLKAESDFKMALQINSNAPEVLNPLALVLTETNRSKQADSLIDIALKIMPDHPYFLNNKGLIQFNLKSVEDADSLVLRSISLDSLNAHAYKNLALIRYDQGDAEEAKTALYKSLQLDSTLLETYDLLLRYGAHDKNPLKNHEILKLKEKHHFK